MENKVNISLEGNSQRLNSELNRGEAKLHSFGATVKNVFAGAQRAVEAANKTFGTFGKITAALGTGMVLKKLFSLEEFEKVDDALLMMQANLHLNAREVENFKDKMSSMAGSAGEDMGALFTAASKLSKVYNQNDILKIMDASSLASHAMEQDLNGVQERIVQIMKMYHKTPDEAKAIAEALTASNADPEILNTLLQRGILKGGANRDYKEVLAMASALKKAGAESSRVVMAVESIMFTVEEKQKVLKRDLGVDIFRIDPATGQKVKKSMDQILTEMQPGMEKWRKRLGDEKFNETTDKLFGQGAHEAFPFLFGQTKTIQKAREEQGRAGEIAAERRAAAEAKWGEQFEKIKGHLAKIKTDLSFIYDLGKKPVKFLADSPNLTKGLGYGAAGLSLAVLGGMAYGKGREFLKNYKGTAVGIAEGKAIEAATGVSPVFVTNWPGSMGGGVLNGGLGTRDIDFGGGVPGLPGGSGKLARFGKFMGKAILPISMMLGSYEFMRSEQEKARGENNLVTADPDWLHRKTGLPQLPGGANPVNAASALNKINLTVNIAKDGRVSTDSDDMNTKIDINRGAVTY